MRSFHLLPVLLLAACASVDDRASCSVSTDCPRGQYCARTPDGSVCWPDAVPPTVSGVSVSCEAPTAGGACLRDGTLRVSATLADDAEVLGADVTLDLGGPAVPMQRGAGGQWTAAVPLRGFPFEHFSHGVVATVTARDGARNETPMDASGVTTVTRLRFSRPLDTGIFGLGPPAVMADGTVVTAGTNGKVYLVPWDGSGLASVAVGTGQITAAPLVLGTSIWIGSEDNKVYEVTNQGGTWTPSERADTGGAVRGALAATSTGSVIATSDFGLACVIPPVGVARNSALGSPYSLGAVVDDADALYLVAGGTLRRMTITLGIPGDTWTPAISLGSTVLTPLAWSSGLIVSSNNGTDGFIKRVGAAGGDPDNLATTGITSGGIAVAEDGSIVIPEATKTLSRVTSSGAPYPGWQMPDLGGSVRTPLVLTSPAVPFVVSTSKGSVIGVAPDGAVSWRGDVGGTSVSLQPGNIYTRGTEPAGAELSIAYFAGSDGVLHAVIVDGRLDASAPWPKAFHDARNTNRAGAPQ